MYHMLRVGFLLLGLTMSGCALLGAGQEAGMAEVSAIPDDTASEAYSETY